MRIIAVILLLLAVVSSVIAADTASDLVQSPWVKITTLGNNGYEGQLLRLRCSAFYGTGQCPGLIWEVARTNNQEFFLNVGAERQRMDARSIKAIDIDWKDSDVGGHMEPLFTIEDNSGRKISAKPSWLTSTSASEALLMQTDGKLVVVTADPTSKSDASKLINRIEFKPGGTETVAPPCNSRIIELEKEIEQLKKSLDDANIQMAILKKRSSEPEVQITQLKSINDKRLAYIKLLEEKLKKKSR